MSFKGIDFYLLDDMLTEEQKLIRSTVRDFVEREVMPIINDAWLQEEFPKSLIPKFAELGLLGPTLPVKYGGSDLDPISYGLMLQELERGDSGIRSFCSVQSSLVMYSIYTFGSEEQKKYYLPRLARGELVGCFGLTEPDAGSDPGALKTRAQKDGNFYILNGSKMWITNGSIADLAIVWAKNDSGEIQGFLVEKGTPGFTAPMTRGKLSLRASVTSELAFNEVRIPQDNLLPNSNGLRSALMPLTQARCGIAWGVIGAAMACLEEVVNYTKERIQFNKPLASFQLTQMKLAEMLTELTQMQLVAYHLGRLNQMGKIRYTHVALAKRNNVRKALEIARLARGILGAAGITVEYQSMRHACNLETVETYEGTYEIQSLILGRELTGIDAFA